MSLRINRLTGPPGTNRAGPGAHVPVLPASARHGGVTFGAGRLALQFGQQKINLHQIGHEFEKAAMPCPGSADLCFIVKGSIEAVQAHLRDRGVTPELDPIPRTGALGPIISVYLRDPDGNLIELSVYGTEAEANVE